MERAEIQSATVRILAPSREQDPGLIILVDQKSVPPESRVRHLAGKNGLEAGVKVWRMIERVALTEDGYGGELVVVLHDVVQIGMRLAPEIRQGFGLRLQMSALVVDIASVFRGHPA